MSVAIIVGLQAQNNVMRVWQGNLLWGLTTEATCSLSAVFVAAGMLAMTPMTAIAVLLSLAIVYISLKASVVHWAKRSV